MFNLILYEDNFRDSDSRNKKIATIKRFYVLYTVDQSFLESTESIAFRQLDLVQRKEYKLNSFLDVNNLHCHRSSCKPFTF